jgi:hypothetical protein
METILSEFDASGKTHHLLLLSNAIKKENIDLTVKKIISGICLLHVHGLQQCFLLTRQP